jgi:hypothetical protein
MAQYKNGKIYKLISPSGLTYIGSTCQTLNQRLAGHRCNYERWKNSKGNYVTSFLIFEEDSGSAQIQLIEEFPCKSKQELHEREGYYIKNTNCVNMVIAGRSEKQYFIDNADRIRERKKVYVQINKDKTQQYQKEYRSKTENKLRMLQQIASNREKYPDKFHKRDKERYERNKETMKIHQKTYYQKNKEKIKLTRGRKVYCVCGKTYTKSNKCYHYRTPHHRRYQVFLDSVAKTDKAFHDMITETYNIFNEML